MGGGRGAETDLLGFWLTWVLSTGGSSECVSPGDADWDSDKVTAGDKGSGEAEGWGGASGALSCGGADTGAQSADDAGALGAAADTGLLGTGALGADDAGALGGG